MFLVQRPGFQFRFRDGGPQHWKNPRIHGDLNLATNRAMAQAAQSRARHYGGPERKTAGDGLLLLGFDVLVFWLGSLQLKSVCVCVCVVPLLFSLPLLGGALLTSVGIGVCCASPFLAVPFLGVEFSKATFQPRLALCGASPGSHRC